MHTTSPCHSSSISTFNKQTPSCPRLLRLLPLHLKLSQQYHCMWHLQKLLSFPCFPSEMKENPSQEIGISRCFPQSGMSKSPIFIWICPKNQRVPQRNHTQNPHPQCQLEAAATFKLSKGSATCNRSPESGRTTIGTMIRSLSTLSLIHNILLSSLFHIYIYI